MCQCCVGLQARVDVLEADLARLQANIDEAATAFAAEAGRQNGGSRGRYAALVL